jgi:hypothetical protein
VYLLFYEFGGFCRKESLFVLGLKRERVESGLCMFSLSLELMEMRWVPFWDQIMGNTHFIIIIV